MSQVSNAKQKAPIERILFTRQEAAESMGMSLRTFERRVQPDVRLVVIGQLKLVAPSELDRWIGEHERAPIGSRDERVSEDQDAGDLRTPRAGVPSG